MKKKIILAITACIFAAGSIINVHLAQHEYNMDFTLADISVMAQADTENGDDDKKDWTVKNAYAATGSSCECFDGGNDCEIYQCQSILSPPDASSCSGGSRCM